MRRIGSGGRSCRSRRRCTSICSRSSRCIRLGEVINLNVVKLEKLTGVGCNRTNPETNAHRIRPVAERPVGVCDKTARRAPKNHREGGETPSRHSYCRGKPRSHNISAIGAVKVCQELHGVGYRGFHLGRDSIHRPINGRHHRAKACRCIRRSLATVQIHTVSI